jgi:hypothetical protein
MHYRTRSPGLVRNYDTHHSIRTIGFVNADYGILREPFQ